MGYELATSYITTDIVCFTGGADVDPQLYGETCLDETYIDPARDASDLAMWSNLRDDQFKVGICRGAQFLNVMNGGRLWQDVDCHALYNVHGAIDISTGIKVNVTSTHHQAMRPASTGVVVCMTERSTVKRAMNETWQMAVSPAEDMDVEAVWYPATNCLCFQPHPELYNPDNPILTNSMKMPCYLYFVELLERYYQPTQKKAA